MKKLIPFVTVLSVLAPVAQAEEERGLSLMERGAQMFMEGILKEMEPAIEEFSGLADDIGPALRQFADQMGPKFTALLREVEDWNAYEAPEILPNGDIIMRRKPDTPEDVPATPVDPAPQIDL